MATPPFAVRPPGTATQLVVTTAPSGVTAGTGFGVVVTAEDGSGTVDTSFDGAVTLALAGDPGITLGGTVSVAAVNGVATFSGLTID